MFKVVLYSLLMIVGILLSQLIDLSSTHLFLRLITLIALAYIMIEVGLEFSIDKSNLKAYGKDYLIAMSAATFPWALCSLYLWWSFEISLSEAAILGRFAAPTSAGVLFTMLTAAGLATTWVFKKVRILAIFDDLDTVLLIVPLQMIYIGFQWRAGILLGVITLLLYVAYRFLHQLRLPTRRIWLLVYAVGITAIAEYLEKGTDLNLEVLLPAFVLGCILHNPHDPSKLQQHAHEHAFGEPEKKFDRTFDALIKYTYMFLVGCSMPKISWEKSSWILLTTHVCLLTVLANLGKLYPMLCYKKEASFKERTALSIAMWPRGEVGAGILLISMGYSINSSAVEAAQLSLALNLALTGLFIYMVIWLLKKKRPQLKSRT